MDKNGRIVATTQARAKAGDSVIEVRTRVPNALAWTSETPHLYKLRVGIKTGAQTLYTMTEKFGFRTISFTRGSPALVL